MTVNPIFCPLCFSTSISGSVVGPFKQKLFQCENCQLIYTERNFYPDLETERIRYKEHKNSPDNERYRTFLNRAVNPTLPYLKAGAQALDYGCGPGPTIQSILEDKGFSCTNYDPIFFPDFPNSKFDVIFATECVEHFHHPSEDFLKLKNLLKKDGILAIMTHPYDRLEDFTSWYYAKDPTHMVFFHRNTFHFIVKRFGLKLLSMPEDRVFIFRNEREIG